MPIRRHLLLLAFSLLVPAVIACGVAILLTYSYERLRAEENLLRTTQALAESVDREFDAIIGRLEALATSPSLERGDMRAFWRQAREAVTDKGMWVVVTADDGQQMVNTLRPLAEPLPMHGPDHPFTRVLVQVLKTGRPVLSDLFLGPVTRKPTLAVTVPVRDARGRIPYVLSMGIDPGAVAGLASSVSLPANWLAGVFDSNLATVARSHASAEFLGKPPVPDLDRAMRDVESGMVDAVSREGIATRVAFSRSPTFGWRFAVGVPTAELAVSAYRTLLVFAVVAAGVLAVGALVATLIAGRISHAIGMLVPAATSLRGGRRPAHRPTGVAEVDAVSVALEETGIALEASEEERRHAELSLTAAKERAEDILSSIADGFYALDGEWRFTYINHRAQQILAKVPGDVLGRPFFTVFPQVRDTAVHEAYARVMETRRPEQFDFVSPILKRWTSFSVYPAPDGGIAVYFRDISARKATEDALVAAKEEAERANRAKSQFLAAASHDLRQPVQSLYFFHEVLADQLKHHPGGVVVASMRRALDALKGLLDGLLDISRLHAGMVEVETAAVPVAALLGRLEAEYAPRAEAQGIGLRFVATTAWVRSDPAQLERILRNLLDNALKYTPGGGRVLVGCRRSGADLLVQVVDTGPGIPAEQQQAIFEEFVQLGNPERDRAKGLGLGLAIVRHLGRLLGHEITVRSRVGHGTIFSVSVPLARPRRQEGRPAVAEEPPPPADRLALVVDDQPMVLDGLRALLQGWGWQVVAAATGDEAMRRLSGLDRPPDVIIADYRLPGEETGAAVIREVRKACRRSVPAVVLTGDTSAERIGECANSGIPLLHKPVDPAALRQALSRVGAWPGGRP